ncbi:hypothetical protein A4A49_34268 [Nicotiana attenuata]|uniref:Secreted protein n=1 Tax=Nicotiana attenuata TaxID=49451 RepID=A0A1J6IQG2_NICAT|nr:hypothetical protein A4A49_34268 [Nicotiana attenuata]
MVDFPSTIRCWLNLISFPFFLYSAAVSQSTTLQISPGIVAENSPGSKPGTKVICERVQTHGLSRLKNLRKYAHSVKVKYHISIQVGVRRNAEVCFHRRATSPLFLCYLNSKN